MTIDDDKFQDFIGFYANYTESSEEWAEKVRRFRASKLYAKMAGGECVDVEQPDITNLTYEDGSKYATTNDHRRTPRPGAPEIEATPGDTARALFTHHRGDRTMLPQLIDQLFSMLWDLAKFVWKLSVVTIVIIGIPTIMLGVLDWLLSFWGIRVTP